MKKEETFGIGEVSKRTGVSERKLRYWEANQYISPQTVICGLRCYRRFTEADIQLIKEIRHLIEEGWTLKSASERAKKQQGDKP